MSMTFTILDTNF